MANDDKNTINVLEKIIYELKPASAELRAEINEKESKINGTNACIVFFNTSVIKVVTASDTARGNRANVLLLDEFRLISKDTIDTILRKFLTLRRMPDYIELTDAERKAEYDKEKNLTLYLSSAYWKDHWAYTKCVDTFKAMLNPDRRQFVCGFPYQLSIREGLLDPELVADDMSDSNFSEVKHSMEMCALFFGSDEGAFFDFESISKNRNIKYPMLPERISMKVGANSPVRIPPKQNGEIRIISADIALMPSKKHKNDATSVFVNCAMKTRGGRFVSNMVYTSEYEGLRTEDQALEIRRVYEEYDGDYIVLDCAGLGLGVYDCLSRDMVDPDTGDIYPALSCCNNSEMASRCTTIGAQKAIWAIKGNAALNSDCALLLREGFRSGRVRLLATEYDADELLNNIPRYKALSPSERLKFQMPYINTTLLVDELTKLQHEEFNGKVRVHERSGMRKDRYSSISYNYYVALQIEQRINKRSSMEINISELFNMKSPSFNGILKNKSGSSPYKRRKGVGGRLGNNNQENWSNTYW